MLENGAKYEGEWYLSYTLYKYFLGLQRATLEMAEAFRSGLMDLVMRAIGRITKPMEEEDLFMQMEMSTRVNGKMIKHMEMECTLMLMAQGMKVSG